MNNGSGDREVEGGGAKKLLDDNKQQRSVVLMWGYLPGASPQRSPLLSPLPAPLPETNVAGDSWTDICPGGCGFAMAVSESGKLITWGSADDQGQSYLTSGMHGEIPEPFPLPTEDSITKAAAGWANCVSITETGEVYTWGWKECIPSAKVVHEFNAVGSFDKDSFGKQGSILTEQVSPWSHGPKSAGEAASHTDSLKRRKLFSAKQEMECSVSTDETLTAPPCLVALDPGVKITSVAAGGRHTLALSDVGQVWGWGYGGEGQLGLGSRIKMVSSPHLIPCIESPSHVKDRPSAVPQGGMSSNWALKIPGNYIKSIACGGRHSAVITDAGALLTFGWGLYGQCGIGNTNDVLRPTFVSSLLGTQIEAIAAGLWHTSCISVEGRVHTFGGNQFGQLGVGTSGDQVESLPRLLDAPILESKHARVISCGARHSALLTEDGKIYCWGWNKYGQLGLGDSIDRNIPLQVSIDDYLPRSIACGCWHTLLLCEAVS